MPRDGAVYRGLGPATPITNQKNSPRSRLQANFMEASSQLRSFFQMTLACVKVTKKPPGSDARMLSHKVTTHQNLQNLKYFLYEHYEGAHIQYYTDFLNEDYFLRTTKS